MSFNKTTTVTQTGLGDDQFKKLQENQGGLGTQIEEGFSGASTKLDNVNTNVTGLGTSLGTKIDNAGTSINENTNTGFGNLSTLLSGYGDSLTEGQTNAAAGREKYYNDMLSALENNTGGLQSSLDAGFNNTSGRFDTLDDTTQSIQDDVTTGFSDQAQAFSDAQGMMTENTADIRGDITSNFDATNRTMETNAENIRGDIGTAQRNVLEGQGGISSDLSDLSATNDTYFQTLADNQANMQSGQDEFRTNFDTYVDRYTDDTTLANQTRSDLQAAQATGFDATRETIGNLADANAQGQRELARQSVENRNELANTVEGGFNQAAQTSQNLREVLSNQIDDSTQGIMSTQDNLEDGQGTLAESQQRLSDTFLTESGEIDAALVNQTKNLAGIASTQSDLDMGMRQNFYQLSTAFDENGQLIQNSVDANGNTIMRELDESDNLMLRALDAQGREVGTKIIDVNESLGQLSRLQRKQGSNMAMGNLSPASQGDVPTGGFTSPFTTTQ